MDKPILNVAVDMRDIDLSEDGEAHIGLLVVWDTIIVPRLVV